MSSIAARRSAPAPEKRTALACRACLSFPSASTAAETGVQRSGSLMISRALTMTALVFGCLRHSHMTTPPEKFAQRPRSPPHLFLRLLIGHRAGPAKARHRCLHLHTPCTVGRHRCACRAPMTYPFRTSPFPSRTSDTSFFASPLLHRRKLAQHLLCFREVSGALLCKPSRSPHLLEHPKFLRGRPL